MKNLFLLCILAPLAILMSACSDDNNEAVEPTGDFVNGYFITNEGPFENGSGSLTFVGDNGEVRQRIYQAVNGEDLGNIVNSMHLAGDKAFIVVNNSNRIVVANRNTMKKEAIIEGSGISNPRHMVSENGKGFISNWGDPFDPEDDFISVINMETNAVMAIIPVGEGPEKMLLYGNQLFVCLQGGFGSNHLLTVIDASSNTVVKNIQVGDVPNSIVKDNSGSLWVLCGGRPAWTGSESPGMLYKYTPGNDDLSALEFQSFEHPSLLSADQDLLYYSLDGKVYEMNRSDAQLPVDALVGPAGFFYGMTVRDGDLFATDAGDFTSEGHLKVFNVRSGALLETIAAGIIPGQVVFP